MKAKCDQCAICCINGIPCHETGCYNTTTFEDSFKRLWVKFEVQTLDVWGNAKEGYEINDVRNTGEVITVPLDFEVKHLVKQLKKLERIGKAYQFRSFDYDDVNLLYKGMPALGLKQI